MTIVSVENLFSKEQIIYFHDLDDLLKKKRYYNTHDQDCRTIAEQGCAVPTAVITVNE